MKTTTRSRLVLFTFLSLAVVNPTAKAVVPPPDGGYPNFTTAEGTNALQNLTTGAANTAVGWFSLFGDTTASFNTGVGAGTLLFNNGEQNTAVGAAALLGNITGSFNTATGVSALSSNTTGVSNNAFGWGALLSNTTGTNNNAIGVRALQNNTEGSANVALGEQALLNNTTGVANTAVGYQALFGNNGDTNTAIGFAALQNNTTGSDNTAVGYNALFGNTTGLQNVAVGARALASITTGGGNIALGRDAGEDLTTGGGNICIGGGVGGVGGESNTTYIRNVFDSITSARQVYVDANHKIGTLASTRRVKDDIESMARASETILALRPVTFRYKKEIDRYCTPQFGLVAEEVAEINPDLVTRDTEGKPQTVRYDAVNAMLLNEFLKEHRKVQELEAHAARQQKEIEALTAGLQKVSTEMQLSRPAARTVLNDR